MPNRKAPRLLPALLLIFATGGRVVFPRSKTSDADGVIGELLAR